MVKLRLAKQGRKKLPIYKVVAADSRARRDGRFIENLGQYRPRNESGKLVNLKEDRIMYWLGVGAQPTATVRSLLSNEGILLKWHLKKKDVDPARADEIYNTWKANKESAEQRKLVAKRDAARKKKEQQAAAAAVPEPAPVVAEEPAAEASPEAPAAEAPAETPAE